MPDFLRKLNEKAYEPKMIAIGPHHHDKDLLLAFEEHKISYLQTLIKRTVIPYPDYVRAMWELEEGARNCYGGSISLDKDDFVQMMLFDGCFIVEVIRKFRLPELRGEDDPIFKLGWMLPSMARDMILLENPLPFFVLGKLFIMTDVKVMAGTSHLDGWCHVIQHGPPFLVVPCRLVMKKKKGAKILAI